MLCSPLTPSANRGCGMLCSPLLLTWKMAVCSVRAHADALPVAAVLAQICLPPCRKATFPLPGSLTSKSSSFRGLLHHFHQGLPLRLLNCAVHQGGPFIWCETEVLFADQEESVAGHQATQHQGQQNILPPVEHSFVAPYLWRNASRAASHL